jgi:DNA helicase IV
MTHERDIAEEQAFLDHAYRSLEFMRGEARSMLDEVLSSTKGGTFQSRTERDIVVRTSLARLEQLEVGDQALCFGRIDVGTGNDEDPEVFHIGRLAVSDEHREPLIIDWRAPIVEPFYRATGLDPMGLVRRRHIAVHARDIIGVEDEYFAGEDGELHVPATDEGAIEMREGLIETGVALGGRGALLAALGRARTGVMGDIIGTIQREQDEIIRAPLPGVLLVQGGPGTGKTAVALHRAAYLLYTYRFPLERQGVLVVGPNPLFLTYIEQVLPSLGETGVMLSTISGLVPEVKIRGIDADELGKLKGDARMTQIISRAVRTRQRSLRQDLAIPYGAVTLRLTVAKSEEIINRVRRRGGPHNPRRRLVEQEMVSVLETQYRNRLGIEEGAEEFDRSEFARGILHAPEIVEALRRMWPRLSAHELLHDFFGAPALIKAAAKDLLDDFEVELLYRARSTSLDAVAWTVADAALIDEARPLLGPRRVVKKKVTPRTDAWPGLDIEEPRRDFGEDEVASFGHIVVDEVQDLSPMQLRMLQRRSLSGSMTVVGDLAQATGPWTPGGWNDVLSHLAPRKAPIYVELSVSYRTPAEVIEASKPVLAASGTGLEAPKPVRRSGIPPVFEQVHADALPQRVVQAALESLEAVQPGRAVILAPARHLGALAEALTRSQVPFADPERGIGGLEDSLVLLRSDEANGLEFDAAIVVEAAEIARAGRPAPTPRGLRTLYVAMTRPTKVLRVISSERFPVEMAL